MSHHPFKSLYRQVPSFFTFFIACLVRIPLANVICAVAVGSPISCQTIASEPRKLGGELSNGGVVRWEPFCKENVDAWKPGRVGYFGNIGVESGAKSSASDCPTSVILAPEGKPVRSEGDKEATDNGYQCDGYCGLYLLLLLFILMYWIALTPSKPNILVKGGHADGSNWQGLFRLSFPPKYRFHATRLLMVLTIFLQFF